MVPLSALKRFFTVCLDQRRILRQTQELLPDLVSAHGDDGRGVLAQIRDWAQALGFQQIGVSDVDVAEHAQRLQHWLQQGYHADMQWMQQHANLRAHPEQLHNNTLRVISVRMDYFPEDDKNLIAKINADGAAYISRYTLGRDYHKLMRKRLAQLAEKLDAIAPNQHRAFVDSAPSLAYNRLCCRPGSERVYICAAGGARQSGSRSSAG